MRKTILFLFTLLFFASCGGSGGGGSGSDQSTSGTALSLEEITPDAPVPSAALNFDVNITLLNFNASQEDKILEAADLIRKVVTSEEFKNAILNHTYNGRKTFADNAGLTNAQIYKKIIEGAESLNPVKDNEMDVQLEIYQENNNTVGYTYPNTEKVWMNTKYFDRNSAAKVTTNMVHEWCHKLGFKHDQAVTAKRPHSVPYAVGYLVARLAAKIQ